MNEHAFPPTDIIFFLLGLEIKIYTYSTYEYKKYFLTDVNAAQRQPRGKRVATRIESHAALVCVLVPLQCHIHP